MINLYLEKQMSNKSTTYDGRWNGYYIEASQEAYNLLIADLYDYSSDFSADTDWDNYIWGRRVGDMGLKTIKSLYLVDGKLSSTKEVPHDEIAELKEKYATGRYDCYCIALKFPYKIPNPIFRMKAKNYKLILKEHSIIADAVIANPDVEVEYKPLRGYWFDLKITFFETYSEELTYRLKEPLYMPSTALSITAEDGAHYEFSKPEFDCEFKFANSAWVYGIVKTQNNHKHTYRWSANGTCQSVGRLTNHYSARFNLTPIVKKWYEDERNFPAIIIRHGGTDLMIVFSKWLYDSLKHDYRLATKQEVNKLYYQDKNKCTNLSYY